MSTTRSVLEDVQARYAKGATTRVPELCCPVDYDTSLLEVLPDEVIERDYGCGDPSRWVRPGDRVLDLGSGSGKICFLASQVAGAEGSVIGVDATAGMLELSRRHVDEVGRKIGWSNVAFRHGHIQDLALDLDRVDAWLAGHPVKDAAGLASLRAEEERLRAEEPLIPDGSVDLVLSNCVLNLVEGAHKARLFAEIARVLAPGGRCAISDIVSDEDVPEHMQRDPELWSGCISGAMREDRFLAAFAEAGLVGVEAVTWQTEPWAVVEGIEFRSVTVLAHRAEDGADLDHREAVVYRGPWSEVVDEDGRRYRRGERTAVSRRAFERLGAEPWADQLVRVPPLVPVEPGDALQFEPGCSGRRAPAETKRGAVREDVAPGVESSSSSCC
jgi:SAM-dependent methyltransferase